MLTRLIQLLGSFLSYDHVGRLTEADTVGAVGRRGRPLRLRISITSRSRPQKCGPLVTQPRVGGAQAHRGWKVNVVSRPSIWAMSSMMDRRPTGLRYRVLLPFVCLSLICSRGATAHWKFSASMISLPLVVHQSVESPLTVGGNSEANP